MPRSREPTTVGRRSYSPSALPLTSCVGACIAWIYQAIPSIGHGIQSHRAFGPRSPCLTPAPRVDTAARRQDITELSPRKLQCSDSGLRVMGLLCSIHQEFLGDDWNTNVLTLTRQRNVMPIVPSPCQAKRRGLEFQSSDSARQHANSSYVSSRKRYNGGAGCDRPRSSSCPKAFH